MPSTHQTCCCGACTCDGKVITITLDGWSGGYAFVNGTYEITMDEECYGEVGSLDDLPMITVNRTGSDPWSGYFKFIVLPSPFDGKEFTVSFTTEVPNVYPCCPELGVYNASLGGDAWTGTLEVVSCE